MIDCIVWAPTEACRTIDASHYVNGLIEEIKDGEEINGDAEETKEEEGAEGGGT